MPFEDASLQCPMFITLKKGKDDGNGGGGGQLRGCIGTLSHKPLAAMRDYVHSSAFRDRRFKPLQQNELVDLQVCVSLLVNYEEASHCYDWVVGIHGILIHFDDPDLDKQYSATYLPEVAAEQGWSQVVLHGMAWHGIALYCIDFVMYYNAYLRLPIYNSHTSHAPFTHSHSRRRRPSRL